MHLKPGDIIRCKAHSGGWRVWQVRSVLLGGEKEESVYELMTLDRKSSTFVPSLYVPCEILEVGNIDIVK